MNRRVLIPEHIVKACDEFGQFAKKWSEVLSKQKDVIKNHIKTTVKSRLR